MSSSVEHGHHRKHLHQDVEPQPPQQQALQSHVLNSIVSSSYHPSLPHHQVFQEHQQPQRETPSLHHFSSLLQAMPHYYPLPSPLPPKPPPFSSLFKEGEDALLKIDRVGVPNAETDARRVGVTGTLTAGVATDTCRVGVTGPFTAGSQAAIVSTSGKKRLLSHRCHNLRRHFRHNHLLHFRCNLWRNLHLNLWHSNLLQLHRTNSVLHRLNHTLHHHLHLPHSHNSFLLSTPSSPPDALPPFHLLFHRQSRGLHHLVNLVQDRRG
ncbi:hypothetical protein BC829DRAFT_384 [Chytridium lagenaria]|nr:hypothetical protein BC829DRAFT_384 [Chytridium lagenaria]